MQIEQLALEMPKKVFHHSVVIAVSLAAHALPDALCPEGIDGFFFLPADCPAVAPGTIMQLKTAFEPGRRVFMPKCGGMRGHPPLLSAELIPSLLAYGGEGGLKGFMSGYERREVNVDDPEISRDMDTPEEYRALLNELK